MLKKKNTQKPATQPKKPADASTVSNQSKPKGSSTPSNATVKAPNSVQAQPAPNLEEKPLTVEERDNLIRQINSLTAQQSEGIIQIV